MFKKVYFVVRLCKVVLRGFNNFLKNVSWGALHLGHDTNSEGNRSAAEHPLKFDLITVLKM